MFRIYTTCNRCGECCRNEIGIPVSKSDLLKWKDQGREDILFDTKQVVRDMVVGDWYIKRGDFLLKTLGKEDSYTCIHLKEESEGSQSCNIYDTRPLICQTYPVSLTGRRLRTPGCCSVSEEEINLAMDIVKAYQG